LAENSFILFAGRDIWRIAARIGGQWNWGEVSPATGAGAPEIASQLSSILSTLGYQGEPTALSIGSDWCLSALIPIGDLPRGDRKAIVYRLEEYLPLPAESIVADFALPAHTGPNDHALGVCAKIELLEPLIDAFEAAGIPVHSIFPTAMAAVQNITAELSSEPLLLLTGEPDSKIASVNLIAMQSGRPMFWAITPATAPDVKLQLSLIANELSDFPRIEAVEIDSSLREALIENTSQIIADRDEKVLQSAADWGAQVLAGRRRPWFEFRRGPLAIRDSLRFHRKPLNMVLSAAVALLLAITAVLLVRSARYAHQEQLAQRQMRDAFGAHFVGWQIPANIPTIVESEHRKAAGASAASLPRESTGSALITLRDVLSRLPSQKGYAVDRMTFEDASFEIAGRLQSYDQADALAAAARATGMQVPPPQTRKDRDGVWTFLIQGTRPASASPQLTQGSVDLSGTTLK
jgi:hypothetical protein